MSEKKESATLGTISMVGDYLVVDHGNGIVQKIYAPMLLEWFHPKNNRCIYTLSWDAESNTSSLSKPIYNDR